MAAENIHKKRFIAGAVCPQCQALDRIVVETAWSESREPNVSHDDPVQEVSRRRCVACGFADEFSAANLINSQGVPRGKPERPESTAKNSVTLAQAVRIVDPKGAPKC